MENVKGWISMDSKWLATLQDREVNPVMLLEDAQKHQATLEEHFEKFFDNYFDLIH